MPRAPKTTNEEVRMIATVYLGSGEVEVYEVDPRTSTLTAYEGGYWHFKLEGPAKKTIAISEDEVVRVEIGEVLVPDDASAIPEAGRDRT